MSGPRYSVIVVSLDAGEALLRTVESVLAQDTADYEVIVKDGGSKDGSVEALRVRHGLDARIRIEVASDRGIYDAMNQATRLARGAYYLFLNCGDYLYDGHVLARTAKELALHPADIAYGDLYRRVQDSTDVAPEHLTDFVCYRNVPNHQVCFYRAELFQERGYDLRYQVRADYEHFLYCVYARSATTHHLPYAVTSYAGGGYSETEAHVRRAAAEHREVTRSYLGRRVLLYRLLMVVTLQPLRKKLADSPRFSAGYHRAKQRLYAVVARNGRAGRREGGARYR